jgi:outer membrane autotransporter protein
VVQAFGELKISGGKNTFNDTVGTAQDGQNISITGDSVSTFLGNTIDAFEGKIYIQSSIVNLDSSNIVLNSKDFELDNGGILNLVSSSSSVVLNTTNAAEIKQGSTVNFKESDISLSSQNGFNIAGKINMALNGGTIASGSGAVTFNNGSQLDIGLNTVTIDASGGILFKSGSVLEIDTDGSSNGVINASSDSVTFFDGAKLKLVASSSSPDYWDNKEIINNGGTFTDYDKVNAGFYTLEAGDSYNLIVKKTKSFSSVLSVASSSPNVPSVGVLMQNIKSPELNARLMNLVQDIVLSDMTPENIDKALRQLAGESLVNVTNSVNITALKTQGVVFNRLDRIREIELDTLTPPAAGSAEELNRVWVGGFGVWSEAKNRNNVYGFDYAGGGMAIGYDRKVAAVPGLRLGVSAAFSAGKLDNNDGLTSVDLKTTGLGLYGSYLLSNNIFFDANVGYAHTNADYTTNLITGGQKTGSYGLNSWQFGLRSGAVLRAGNFQFIPSVGLRYVTVSQDAFVDHLSEDANTEPNRYAKHTDNMLDIPVQVKINTTFQAGSATVTPELRLGYTLATKKADNAIVVNNFGNESGSSKIYGTRARGNSGQVGVGLKVDTGGVVDFFVNYDLDVAKGYHSHNASLGLGFEF